MPISPSLLERAALAAGLGPAFLTDVVGAASLRAFGVAEQIGLFAILRGGPATADQLAAKVSADGASLRALLELLARTGWLRRTGERYRNAPSTERWITSGDARGLPDFARYWYELIFDGWSTLADAVRSGRPAPHLHEWLDRRSLWPIFNAAMAELAAHNADAIARAVPLPSDARRLVDVGGSHGLYAVAFCRRHPTLSATIVDLPQALGPARERIAAAGFASRIEVHAADALHDELGGPYDVALLFQLIHYFPPERVRELLGRVRDALAPGGLVVIFDQVSAAAPTPVAAAFLAALDLAYRTGLGGALHRYDEIASWLRETGFQGVRRKTLRSAPGNALVLASRA
jgi:hypothetical protein